MSELDQQRIDGERAQYALEYLGPKFAKIEGDLVELWAEANMHDDQTKDELLRSVKNLRRLRDLIQSDIVNGDLAAKLIHRSAKDRIRDVIGW